MKNKFFRVICFISIFLFLVIAPTSNCIYAMNSYYYDTNGRLIQESDLSGEAVRYLYDQNGNLISKNTGEPYFEFLSAFDSKQGRNNWYYQTWNGTRYEDMSWDITELRWKGKNSWDIINKEWIHPDGNDSVLKWVAPQTGSIRVTGRVAKHPVNLQGDGVRVKIMKNNTPVWPATGWKSIQGDDATGIEINLNLNVTMGDSIYFIVNQNGSTEYDATSWNPEITYIGE